MKRFPFAVLIGLCCCAAPGCNAPAKLAHDAVNVDPSHYKVAFENEEVRVVRIHYGPHEKSVMHDHRPGTLIFLTDHHVRFTYPDGRSEEVTAKAGQVQWEPGITHLPENLTDKPLELILVEQK